MHFGPPVGRYWRSCVRAFRYGTMPAHPHFGEQDLADLVAYFRAMSKNKRDPNLSAHSHEHR
jgi:hypothetical protein